MRSVRVVLFLVAALVIASPVLANPVPPWVANMTKGMTLNDDEKAALEKVKKDFSPKAPAINGKLGDAAKKLSAAANAWGSGAKLNVVEDAMAQVTETTNEAVKLEKDVHDAVMAALTDANKEILKKQDESKKGAKKEDKKEDKKDGK